MKVQTTARNVRAAQDGSLLLPSLCIAGLIGVALASYLTLTETQNVSIARSQTWNTTMAVTEAGVEDGLQLINQFAGSFDPEALYQWTNTTLINGWENPAPGTYHTVRYITNSSATSTSVCSYDTWVYNTNNMPTVVSRGNVPWNYQYAQAGSPQPIFAQAGLPYSTSGALMASRGLNRSVCVQTHYDPLFVVAMAAVNKIDLNGNGVSTDSFDSADPTHSLNGWYPTNNILLTKDNGSVCTDLSVVDSLNVGNANVRGHVRTGDGLNTVFTNNNCSVGDYTWVVKNQTSGIKPGYMSTDFNVAFPSVTNTATGWLPPTFSNMSVDGVLYQYVISAGGNYAIGSLTGSLLVNAPSNTVVKISIASSVYLSGNQVIRISPTGCEVRIYMYGNTFSLTGNAYIDNQSGMAYNFYLFGMPSCTSITFGGNASFYGGVYAPQAAFTLGGGGNNPLDFVGASVTRTVFMNGHFHFHYDENLARVGPGRGYVPVAWSEI